jgi:hypothetical protein
MYGITSEDFFNGDFLSYRIDPSDESIKYYNKEIAVTYAEENNFKITPSDEMSYYLNNYAHRSDDFEKLNKDKYNILFSGCSATFGDALPDQFRWSKILYNDLNIKDKGPYQCLSFLGGGADKIVGNIMKYCYNFGNPNAIFVLFNDFTRHIEYIEEENSFRSKINLDFDHKERKATISKNVQPYNLFMQTQNYVRILEIYCSMNNIKLFFSSVDSQTREALSNIELLNFKPIDLHNLLRSSKNLPGFPENSKLEKKYQKYLIRARDNKHDGILNNFLYRTFFLNQFEEMHNV